VVRGGTHIMILTKYRWLNNHLPKIMLETEWYWLSFCSFTL
jgi:hypothetical protein